MKVRKDVANERSARLKGQSVKGSILGCTNALIRQGDSFEENVDKRLDMMKLGREDIGHIASISS